MTPPLIAPLGLTLDCVPSVSQDSPQKASPSSGKFGINYLCFLRTPISPWGLTWLGDEPTLPEGLANSNISKHFFPVNFSQGFRAG